MVIPKEKDETLWSSCDSENCHFLTFFILKTFSCFYSLNELNMRGGRKGEFGKVMQPETQNSQDSDDYLIPSDRHIREHFPANCGTVLLIALKAWTKCFDK